MSLTGPSDVTVVIPSYNDGALLARNLPAVLRAAEAAPGEHQVIVVDDASTEGGRDELASRFPSVHWLRHQENQGFSAAIATGVASASTDFLVFLNSDVAPAEDFLRPLTSALEDSEVFAASPLILDEEGAPYRESWNRYRFAGGRLRERPWDLQTVSTAAGPLPSLYTSGGSMAVRRSYFLALGGFAPIYRPFYVEDLDLGVRAWRHGWRVVFVPSSTVVHQRTGTISANVHRSRVKRIQRRNRLLFEWAHFSLWRILFYRGPYYVKQLAGRALRGDRDYLAGFAAALTRVPQAVRHRRQVESIAARDFESVLSLLDQG